MGKLLALLSLGQNMYGKWLLRRLMFEAIIGVSLAIISAALVSMMIVGCFYGGYTALLQAGYERDIAMLIVGGVAIIITLALVLFTVRHLRRLREMPRRLLMGKAPHLTQAGGVVDAFMEGFMGKPQR